MSTKIEWTDETWNPVIGCDRVGPGCDNCYAMPTARVRAGNPNPGVAAAFAGTTKRTAQGVDWTGRLNVLHGRLLQPLKWRKPRRVFVNSLSDLFHAQVPDAFIASVFAVMALAPQHTFQVLTKRHGRMKSLLSSQTFTDAVWGEMERLAGDDTVQLARTLRDIVRARIARWSALSPWPLPNVWLGVSAEDQQHADLRIPALLATPAAVRFVSAEPLLGPLFLDDYMRRPCACCHGEPHEEGCDRCADAGCDAGHVRQLDWVIVGGESGRGARPMHPDWARTIRDQCAQDHVPFFFKQWGEWITTTVRDDPGFAGGRVFDHPGGGLHAPVVREPGPSGTFRGAKSRLLRPGETAGPFSLLDPDTIAVRVGKKAAGRELDRRTWNQHPHPGTPAPAARKETS